LIRSEGDIPLVTRDLIAYLTDVGFKYVATAMLNGLDPKATLMIGKKIQLAIGFEESAGFAIAIEEIDNKGKVRRLFVPDKDGLIATILFYAVQARQGKNIVEIIDGLEQEFGQLNSERLDVTASLVVKVDIINSLLDGFKQGERVEIAGIELDDIQHIGGIYYDRFNLIFIDSQTNTPVTFKVRMSGTEPIVRIYIEAMNRDILNRFLQEAKGIILESNIKAIEHASTKWSLVEQISLVDITDENIDRLQEAVQVRLLREDMPETESIHNILEKFISGALKEKYIGPRSEIAVAESLRDFFRSIDNPNSSQESETEDANDSAIVYSHDIKEEWGIEIKDQSIQATATFFSGEQEIGQGWIDIDSTAASIHTCWFKSHFPGQRIGKEMAARMYIRSYEISQLFGLNTQYAHAFYWLSPMEEAELDYSSRNTREEMHEQYTIFRELGLEEKVLKGKDHIMGYSGYRYYDHIVPLEEVVNNAKAHWQEWYYRDRVGTQAWDRLKNEINWHEVQRYKAENDRLALRSIYKQLFSQLGPEHSKSLEIIRRAQDPQWLKEIITTVSKRGFRIIEQTKAEAARSDAEVDLRKDSDRKELITQAKILLAAFFNEQYGQSLTRAIESLISKKDTSVRFKIAYRIARAKERMLRLENIENSKTYVEVVFAVYNSCKYRMMNSEEHVDGEDSLREKIRQLEYLFEGIEKFDWRLRIVDDGSKAGAGEYAISILEEEYPQYLEEGRIVVDFLEEAIIENLRKPEEQRNPVLLGMNSGRDSIKGGSINYGMHEAAKRGSDIVIFTDSDNSSLLYFIGDILWYLIEGEYDAAVGSRALSDSIALNRGPKRMIQSWQDTVLFNWFATRQIVPEIKEIKDTQNGFKGFRKDLLLEILPKTQIRGAIFDVELIYLSKLFAKRKGVKEFGMPWVDSPGVSNFSFRDGLKMRKDLKERAPMIRKTSNQNKSNTYPLLVSEYAQQETKQKYGENMILTDIEVNHDRSNPHPRQCRCL